MLGILIFSALSIPTGLSVALLVAPARGFTLQDSWYDFIVANRATVQLVIQVVSGIMGVINTAVFCQLVNYSSRVYIAKRGLVSMDALQGWHNMAIPTIDWQGSPTFLILTTLAASLSLVSSALWAGALTPVVGTTTVVQPLRIPAFTNTSLIVEYPSEVDKAGPNISTPLGLFSYSVGMKHIGSLLASAASATTPDGSIRQHPKLDNTQFIYSGRSYGAGAAVGLSDVNMTSLLPHANGYTYTELGYVAGVSCVYNRSTDFTISRSALVGNRIYPVTGNLPDTPPDSIPEYSEYVGHSPDTIVAIGVANSLSSPRRYLAIAAGASYRPLNATQCAVDFSPSLFSVSVSLTNRSISVEAINNSGDTAITEPDPPRNLTRTLMRQFELIANDLTNIYESVLGAAFMSSVAAWNLSLPGQSSNKQGDDHVVLQGLTNSITAMTDDMLASYAAAQLMVGNISSSVDAQVQVQVMRVGERRYAGAVAGISLLLVCLVLAETIRTRGWRGLPEAFDISDLAGLVMASFRGGARSGSGAGGSSRGGIGGPGGVRAVVGESEREIGESDEGLLGGKLWKKGGVLLYLKGDADGKIMLVMADRAPQSGEDVNLLDVGSVSW